MYEVVQIYYQFAKLQQIVENKDYLDVISNTHMHTLSIHIQKL